MEVIGKDEFDKAKDMMPTIKDEVRENIPDLDNIGSLLREMENPVNFQKELAVKVKLALDLQMKLDLDTKGYLSSNTRGWVDSYNKILDRLQSALHGDKSVNLHLHKVSHSDISSKIRESLSEVSPDEELEVQEVE